MCCRGRRKQGPVLTQCSLCFLDVHLLYLSRRAALHGRKLPGSRPGPALAGDDGCSSAGPSPDRCCDHHKLLVNLKRMMRAHKKKLQAALELPRCPPSHFQQQLGTPLSGDLLESPMTLGEANSTGETGWSIWGCCGFESGVGFENWHSPEGRRLPVLAGVCLAQFIQCRTRAFLQEGISAASKHREHGSHVAVCM